MAELEEDYVFEREIGEQETKVDREHDRILKEIETTDTAFVGASLRAVYEGNDHEKFTEKLDSRIKQHDRDIERLCNFHYQGFIESITELIKVRSDAETLKKQVVVINKELQESGKELARKCEDLMQCRLQQRNIASAIDQLSMCLPVLHTYAKMQDQMEAGRYYSALKTLEQLEHTYLPRVHEYRFCEIMIENIPKIRERIKEVSMSELKDFLEVVRRKSGQIGSLAMSQVDKERKLENLTEADGNTGAQRNSILFQESPTEADRNHLSKNEYRRRHSKKKNRKKSDEKQQDVNPNQRLNPFDQSLDDLDSSNPFAERNGDSSNPFEETNHNGIDTNPFEVADDASDDEDEADRIENLVPQNSKDISPSDLVDFSPVYKCLHIFGILKSHDEFKKYYRSQRSRQASIALQPPTNMHESLEGYSSYCHQIVGFFVVEDHILHTAQNLIDRIYIDSLWDKALLEIISVFRTDSDYCGGADMLMSVKNLIVVFADTLKAYGFIVDQLFSLLIEMRDQYSDILLKKWSDLLQTIFDEDNYTPIQVNSDSEAIRLLSSFPYEDTEFEKASFPKYLPFSRFVPNVFNEIKRFILACLEYCEDLHLSSTEVDDMIRKSTNLLLTRTLSGELQKLVRKSSLGLTELVQITINTSYLENSCKHVEQFVHSVTGVDSSASHTAKLVGVSTFKDARCETESQIYFKLNSKIDEFFDLADYNWNVSEPLGTASSYLLDLIAFLKHNFKVFTHLPEKVAQTGCMSACKHISTRLMELVMDREMRQVTMAALQQFNLDVMQCELFSNSEPVPGFQDGALQMSFLELRQLLDLFLSWDWSSYLADYGSGSSKYLRVNPATALALLEKVREDSKHRNIFTSFTRQEREKKKLLETVLKQLRNIVNVPEEHVSQAPAPAPKIWNYLENKFLSKKVV